MSDTTTFGHRVASALKWATVGRGLTHLITWCVTIVVMRILGPEAYGLLAMTMLLPAFLSLFYEGGLSAAIVQREQVDEALLRSAFGLILAVSAALYLALFVCAPAIAAHFEEPVLVDLVRVAGLQLLTNACAVVPNAILNRAMNFKPKAILRIITQSVTAAVVLALALGGAGVWALIIGSTLQSAMWAVGLATVAGFLTLPSFNVSAVRGMLRFGTTIAVQRLAWFAYSRADALIIGTLLGTTALGIYGVAMHLASVPMQKANMVLNQVMLPAFSSIQSEPQHVTRAFLRGTRLLALLAVPVFFGIASVATEFVPVFLGPKWLDSIPILQLIVLIMPLRMLNTMLHEALNGTGRPGLALGNVLLAAVLVCAGVLIGVQFGLMGVAWAWIATFPIVVAAGFWRSRHALALPPGAMAKALLRPAIAGVLMVAAVALTRALLQGVLGPAGLLACGVGVGALTYLSLCGREIARETAALWSKASAR